MLTPPILNTAYTSPFTACPPPPFSPLHTYLSLIRIHSYSCNCIPRLKWKTYFYSRLGSHLFPSFSILFFPFFRFPPFFYLFLIPLYLCSVLAFLLFNNITHAIPFTPYPISSFPHFYSPLILLPLTFYPPPSLSPLQFLFLPFHPPPSFPPIIV